MRYYVKTKSNNSLNHSTSYSKQINEIANSNGYENIIGNVFLSMLKIIQRKEWEGACHPTASILYVIYKELGFNVELLLGEVKIDYRYFDHSWIELDGLIIDASLISPINKKLGLSPVFLNIDLNNNKETSLQYGETSTMGLSEFTKIIYKRPFHKYMNPFPWGKGKWSYVEEISNELNLNIDINVITKNYKEVKRILLQK